ncbi:beta strand repeat-containing protein [Enterococcus sp. LJL120]
MKLKRIIVGFLAIMLAVGGLGIANVFQETEVTEAANGDDFATVTFRTTADYPFDDGTTERVVQVDLEAIETMELPLFESTDSASFVGWNLTSRFDALTTLHPNELVVGTTYSPATLLRQGFYAGDEAVFTAVTANQGAEGSTDMYEYGQTTKSMTRVPSISTAADAPSSGNLIVYSYDGNSYKKENSYTVSVANFQQALFDLYENGDAKLDYVLYVGGAVATLPTSIGARTTVPTTASEVSFYSLQNKIGSLTITGNTADNVNDTPATSEPSTSVSNRLTFASCTTLNFGTDVEIRNIWYSNVTNLAANGYNLYLGGGSWGNRTAYVFGGSSDGTLVPNPGTGDTRTAADGSVTIFSTGTGTWNLYGGNNWGEFTGDSYLTVNNTSNAINNITGGSGANGFNGNTYVTVYNTRSTVANIKGGNDSYDVNGNTNVAIHNVGGSITGIYGGQPGAKVTGNTSLKIYVANSVTNIYGGAQSGTVGGNVSNFIRSTSSSFNVTNFYGGTYNGTVNGDISTLYAGYGRYSGTHFAGVGYTSNVGSDTNRRQVSTILDTSLYSSGNFFYSGVNRVSGVVYADILNVTRAGRYRGGASIQGYNGTSATESSKLTQSGLGAIGVAEYTNLSSTDVDNGVYATTYDGYTPEERRSRAEAAATNRVYGNVTSHALGGSMSNAADQTGYMRAGGYGGYIEGNTSITTGIIYGAGQDEKAGGYNFVRNQTIDDSYYNNAATNAMQDFKYIVSTATGSSTSQRTHATNGAFDIVGGTGEAEGERYGAYLYGDSNLTHNNVLARWTYGSNFGGIHEGNSTITLNGGLVDTLEGSGYRMVRHYGDSTAIMNNGEINFFYSGGGWGDWAMFGDVTAYCTGGIINCAIGGTYGMQNSATSHYVFGDANTIVTGGKFNGYPSHGSRGFSGGATQSGHIYGDVALTLDLRNSDDFAMPSGTSVTGGRSMSGNGWTNTDINTIGKDENSTITLNIYTKSGSNVLNGTNIYGDGGPDSNTGGNSSRSGKIIMNIDAPDSTIGNLYATQYRNIPTNTNTLRKSVDINVLRVGQIGSLSGGNANDSMNNTVSYNSSVASTPKTIDVKLGTELLENSLTGYAVKVADIADAEKDISFGTSSNTVGLVNFTNLSVQNGFTALAGYGSIKNGVSATENLHYNQYDKFGDVTIEDGSGLGVTSSGAFISLGNLTVNGEGGIYSPAGNGKINLSGITMANDTDRLTWHMQSGGSNTVASNGSYFGAANAYQVLTFTATEANGTTPKTGMASDITPINFMGIDDSSGKTFVGDNDLVTNASSTASNHREFGIMIPGSVIDYTVSGDYDPDDLTSLLSAGTGLISHDVTLAKSFDEVTPTGDLKAIATWAAGVEETSGRLVIPILGSDPIYPTLTLNPDDPTGSWLRSGTVDSTKTDNTLDETIGEQDNSNSMYWKMGVGFFDDNTTSPTVTTSDANEYSYTIDIVFSNELELTGRNVIVTEDQAKTLTDNEAVQTIQNIFGRPFLTTDLSQADLDSLQVDLDTENGEYSRTIGINYHIQDHETTPVNESNLPVNIVIVPNGTVISDELDFALYANDGQMTLAEAGVATEAEVNA